MCLKEAAGSSFRLIWQIADYRDVEWTQLCGRREKSYGNDKSSRIEKILCDR